MPPTPDVDSLVRTLDRCRRHVVEALEGLDDEQLRTPVLPSGWSPVELTSHLTLGGERYWFASIVGGEPLDWMPVGWRADWQTDPSTPTGEIIGNYERQIERSNATLAGVDLDDPPRQRDPTWEVWGVDFPTVRAIVHHMIVETATHAGHLDAAVELLDGRQRLVIE